MTRRARQVYSAARSTTDDMKVLLIINGPAYGSDETFNAIRLAVALAKRNDTEPRVFLMATQSPLPVEADQVLTF